MMTGILVRLGFLPAHPSAQPTAMPARPHRCGSRRRSARAAVWSGVAAFVGLTAALAGAIDTVKPEWRDPEFAYRLQKVQQWRAKAPERPLVIAFGSSRTQMGLAPAAMGFPDEPGSPVVFNFGYRAGHPLGAWLHFTRVLDSGVRPDAVLIQLAPPELMVLGYAERQYSAWAPRFSRDDIRRLAPYTRDDTIFQRTWLTTRLKPWTTYRQAIISDLIPDWHTHHQRKELEWERMDEYGFSPHPFATIPPARRRELETYVRQKHRRALRSFALGPTPEPVYQNLLDRCSAAGIAVAFFWAPTSPKYQSWHTPSSLAAIEEFKRWFATRFPVTVFPPAPHMEDLDFADGYHLLRHGAAKYSRWLAENHLRPWLVSRGLAK